GRRRWLRLRLFVAWCWRRLFWLRFWLTHGFRRRRWRRFWLRADNFQQRQHIRPQTNIVAYRQLRRRVGFNADIIQARAVTAAQIFDINLAILYVQAHMAAADLGMI